MAEESLSLSVTQKFSNGSSSRYHLGKTSSSNGGEKEGKRSASNRRASIGSCHDSCKFGRHHESEVREREPVSKRVTGKSRDDKGPVEVLVLPEIKKTRNTMPKPKPSPTLKVSDGDSSVSKDHESPMKSTSSKPKLSDTLDEQKKTSAEQRPVLNSVTQKLNTRTDEEQEVPVSSERVEVSSEQDLPNTRETGLAGQQISVLKLRPIKLKPVPSDGSFGDANVQKNNNVKTIKCAVKPGVAAKKAVVTPFSPRSKKAVVTPFSPRSASRGANLLAGKPKGLKVGSPLKNQGKVRKAELKPHQSDDVPEKTLYVVTDEKHPESDKKQHDSDVQTPENDEVDIKETTIPTRSNKGKTRKPGTPQSEEKNRPSLRLSLVRGDIKPPNSPRRLKFINGRLSGETQKTIEVQRRSFKREGANITSGGSEPARENVVLRHQDAPKKKDVQVLFNKVIEETASKLAQNRKSKVKALVGAFETVISLQEGSSSQNIVH